LEEKDFALTKVNLKTKIVSGHTADSKPVKQEVNGTVILPALVFPAFRHTKAMMKESISQTP
jgi:hypothetical protein